MFPKIVLLALFIYCAINVNAMYDQYSPVRQMFYLMTSGEPILTIKQYGVLKASLEHMNSPVDLEGDLALREVFNHIDMNGNNEIDVEEFASYYSTLDIHRFDGSPEPEQIRVSYGGDIDAMDISWVSYINPHNDSTPPEPKSMIFYGLTPDSMNTKVYGNCHTYDVGLFGGWHGWISDVSLVGLKPDTTYYYSVGDGITMSDTSYFTTTTEYTSNKSTVFGTLGDAGTVIPAGFDVSKLVANHLHGDKPLDFLAHVGDLCYATLIFPDLLEWEYTWDMWGRQNEQISRYIPYMTTVGNHEKPYNYTSYRNRLHMPGDAQEGANDNFYFYYSRGNVFYLSISTELEYNPESEQYIWIDKILNKYSKQKDWIVVGGHRPMYNSEVSEFDAHSPHSPFAQALEPLLIKYNVDVYIGGHMHGYERTYPVNNGTIDYDSVSSDNKYINPSAPWHLTVGTGGVFLDYLDKNWVQPAPEYSVFRSGRHYGYGRFEAHNSTHLEYSFYNVKEEVIDHLWVVKDAKQLQF